MEQQQRESLDIFMERYKDDASILAILMGGSIAHGFAKPDSDIDIMLIVDEVEYEKRKRENKLTFSLWDVCTYSGGYIDCKVVSLPFLRLVAERGSDPARYAFQDCIVLQNRIPGLEELLARVTEYPVDRQEERRKRFVSQLLAWKWYYSEAVKKQNDYLKVLAIQKIVLFASRIVLNENKQLYPYHKWLLAETHRAPLKPASYDAMLAQVLAAPAPDNVNPFCEEMLRYLNLEEQAVDWPNQFLIDSEWNWVEHEPPVDDL